MFPGVSLPESVCMDGMHMLFLGEGKKHLEKLHETLKIMCPMIDEVTSWEVNFSKVFAKFSKQNGNCVSPSFGKQKFSQKPAFTILKLLIWGAYLYWESGDNLIDTNDVKLFKKRCKMAHLIFKKNPTLMDAKQT